MSYMSDSPKTAIEDVDKQLQTVMSEIGKIDQGEKEALEKTLNLKGDEEAFQEIENLVATMLQQLEKKKVLPREALSPQEQEDQDRAKHIQDKERTIRERAGELARKWEQLNLMPEEKDELIKRLLGIIEYMQDKLNLQKKSIQDQKMWIRKLASQLAGLRKRVLLDTKKSGRYEKVIKMMGKDARILQECVALMKRQIGVMKKKDKMWRDHEQKVFEECIAMVSEQIAELKRKNEAFKSLSEGDTHVILKDCIQALANHIADLKRKEENSMSGYDKGGSPSSSSAVSPYLQEFAQHQKGLLVEIQKGQEEGQSAGEIFQKFANLVMPNSDNPALQGTKLIEEYARYEKEPVIQELSKSLEELKQQDKVEPTENAVLNNLTNILGDFVARVEEQVQKSKEARVTSSTHMIDDQCLTSREMKELEDLASILENEKTKQQQELLQIIDRDADMKSEKTADSFKAQDDSQRQHRQTKVRFNLEDAGQALQQASIIEETSYNDTDGTKQNLKSHGAPQQTPSFRSSLAFQPTHSPIESSSTHCLASPNEATSIFESIVKTTENFSGDSTVVSGTRGASGALAGTTSSEISGILASTSSGGSGTLAGTTSSKTIETLPSTSGRTKTSGRVPDASPTNVGVSTDDYGNRHVGATLIGSHLSSAGDKNKIVPGITSSIDASIPAEVMDTRDDLANVIGDIPDLATSSGTKLMITDIDTARATSGMASSPDTENISTNYGGQNHKISGSLAGTDNLVNNIKLSEVPNVATQTKVSGLSSLQSASTSSTASKAWDIQRTQEHGHNEHVQQGNEESSVSLVHLYRDGGDFATQAKLNFGNPNLPMGSTSESAGRNLHTLQSQRLDDRKDGQQENEESSESFLRLDGDGGDLATQAKPEFGIPRLPVVRTSNSASRTRNIRQSQRQDNSRDGQPTVTSNSSRLANVDSRSYEGNRIDDTLTQSPEILGEIVSSISSMIHDKLNPGYDSHESESESRNSDIGCPGLVEEISSTISDIINYSFARSGDHNGSILQSRNQDDEHPSLQEIRKMVFEKLSSATTNLLKPTSHGYDSHPGPTAGRDSGRPSKEREQAQDLKLKHVSESRQHPLTNERGKGITVESNLDYVVKDRNMSASKSASKESESSTSRGIGSSKDSAFRKQESSHQGTQRHDLVENSVHIDSDQKTQGISSIKKLVSGHESTTQTSVGPQDGVLTQSEAYAPKQSRGMFHSNQGSPLSDDRTNRTVGSRPDIVEQLGYHTIHPGGLSNDFTDNVYRAEHLRRRRGDDSYDRQSQGVQSRVVFRWPWKYWLIKFMEILTIFVSCYLLWHIFRISLSSTPHYLIWGSSKDDEGYEEVKFVRPQELDSHTARDWSSMLQAIMGWRLFGKEVRGSTDFESSEYGGWTRTSNWEKSLQNLKNRGHTLIKSSIWELLDPLHASKEEKPSPTKSDSDSRYWDNSWIEDSEEKIGGVKDWKSDRLRAIGQTLKSWKPEVYTDWTYMKQQYGVKDGGQDLEERQGHRGSSYSQFFGGWPKESHTTYHEEQIDQNNLVHNEYPSSSLSSSHNHQSTSDFAVYDTLAAAAEEAYERTVEMTYLTFFFLVYIFSMFVDTFTYILGLS